jgi:hypothetical protein
VDSRDHPRPYHLVALVLILLAIAAACLATIWPIAAQLYR